MLLLLNLLIGRDCFSFKELMLGLNFHMNAMNGALHDPIFLNCAHNLIEKQVNFLLVTCLNCTEGE